MQIYLKKLEGDLNLSDFINLEILNCEGNELTALNLSNCDQLEQIYCDDNLLTNLILPTNLNNLKYLDLRNNNFPVQDLSFLVGATNLVSLSLGNWDKEKIQQGIYNRWNGSLNYLSEMEKLNGLIIYNTDINTGLEYLPNSLRGFFCSATDRPESGVKNIEQELTKYGEPDESYLNDCSKLLAIWRTNNQSLINKTKQLKTIKEEYHQKIFQLEQNLEQVKQKTQEEIEQLKSKLTQSEQEKYKLQERIQNLQTEIKVLKQEQLIAQIKVPPKTNN